MEGLDRVLNDGGAAEHRSNVKVLTVGESSQLLDHSLMALRAMTSRSSRRRGIVFS